MTSFQYKFTSIAKFQDVRNWVLVNIPGGCEELVLNGHLVFTFDRDDDAVSFMLAWSEDVIKIDWVPKK